MQLAYRAAHRFQHDHVGADHILLGVMREDSGEVTVLLSSFQVDRDALLKELESNMEPGESPVASEQLPLTPFARNVLARARKEAQILLHEHLGPLHLLLGVLHGNRGLAVEVLNQFGMDYMAVWRHFQERTPSANRDHQMQIVAPGENRVVRDPSSEELEDEITDKPLPVEMTPIEPEEEPPPLDPSWHAPSGTSRDTLYRQLRYIQHVLGMSAGFLGGYLAYGLQGGAMGVICALAIVSIQRTVVSLIVGFFGGFAVGLLHTGHPLGTVVGALLGTLVGGCLGGVWISQRRFDEDEP